MRPRHAGNFRTRTLFSNGLLGMLVLCTGLAFVFFSVRPPVLQSQRKTCVDCHEEIKKKISKGGAHQPAKESCETCHKRHGFTQKLVLVKAMPELCIDCHEGITEELSGDNVHAALSEGGCTVCHDPHASEEAALQRTTESGTPVCVTCHADLSETMADADTHDPFRKGDCSSCHNSHASDRPNLLVASETDVCEKCHQGAGEKHKNPGMTDFSCVDCHDAHKASNRHPMAAYSHEPFAAGECETCHTLENGEVTLGDDFPSADMCSDCHDGEASLVAGSDSHFGAGGLKDEGTSTCLECHNPHTSRFQSLAVQEEDNLCRKCHENLPASGSFAGSMHSPFARGSCSDCHNPHGGGGDYHLAQEPDALCSGCHAAVVKEPQPGETKHAALDVVSCVDCHASHASTFAPLLKDEEGAICFGCHDEESHDIAHPPYQTASCGACHKNHSTMQNLLVGTTNAVCARCHAQTANQVNAPVAHPPAQEEACTSCHLPHGAAHEGLLAESQGELCFGCHDRDDLLAAVTTKGAQEESSPPPGEPVTALHEPFAAGECDGCHNPHGSEFGGLLVKKSEGLCYKCHLQEKAIFEKGTQHQPVKDGQCSECHTPHGTRSDDSGSPVTALLKTNESELCARCHDFSKAPLKDSHGSANVAAAKCTACHDPHSSTGEHLMNPFMHEPFADNSCDVCHEGFGETEKTSGVMAAMPPVSAGVCLDCHDEKSGENGHHRKEGVSCVDCHTPHASKSESLLKTPERLCWKCHEDVLNEGAKKDKPAVLHKPIETGGCLECHKMHDPPGDGFLVQDQKALCSSCHETMKARSSHPVQHAPFLKGNCSSCHNTHASSEAHLLKWEEERLCKSCHGLSSEKMTTSHKRFALSGKGCTSCHDPHSTEKAGRALILPVLHSPYDEGDCSACHDESGKTINDVAICLDCHDDGEEYAAVHAGSGENIPCLDCHSPHAGYNRLFKRGDEAKTCTQCHDRTAFNKQNKHAALESGCSACHDVHNSDIESLRGEKASARCIECHEESAKHIHPIGSEYKDPRTDKAMTCLACHDPHSSDHEYMLTFDRRRDLCVQCHSGGHMKTH